MTQTALCLAIVLNREYCMYEGYYRKSLMTKHNAYDAICTKQTHINNTQIDYKTARNACQNQRLMTKRTETVDRLWTSEYAVR